MLLVAAEPDGAMLCRGYSSAPADWRRAVDFALAHMRRPAGMSFAGLGSNSWTEGTAQTALTLLALGRATEADAMTASTTHAAPLRLMRGW